MELRFNHLESLHWLWAVVALLVVAIVSFRLKHVALRRFADAALLGRLTPRTSFARQCIRTGLVLLALVALVAAMIDPRWGLRFERVQQRGIDIMVVLDVSRSMLAEDARPNRFERARQFIIDLVGRLKGDRVGLVTFAGAATVRCPLTVDYGAFRLSLDMVSPEAAPRGGSLLGDALRTAAAAFTDEHPDHKAIVVLTDGEDHGSYAIEAAQRIAEELSTPVYCVGIGDSREGGRIPVMRNGRRDWLIHDGQVVWSTMNAGLLRDVALASGGAFVPVGTGTVDMGEVYEDRIEPVAKREFETREIRRYTPRYQWFAGLALLLLLVESFVSDRRPGRAGRANPEARS